MTKAQDDYRRKLQHPKWQKRRLECLNAAEWTCEVCMEKDDTLHVHHLDYVGENPWDAPNEAHRELVWAK